MIKLIRNPNPQSRVQLVQLSCAKCSVRAYIKWKDIEITGAYCGYHGIIECPICGKTEGIFTEDKIENYQKLERRYENEVPQV